jgi:MYXO-CTERM domain-containing protein
MPPIDNLTLGCNMFAGAPHESGGRRHVLVGANVGAMAVNQLLYGDAGTGEVEDWRYDESIGWAQELAGTAATLDVEFPDAVDLAAGLPSLAVRVTNETGHKLPTGYAEGRVMWLEVVARYQGEVVWSSGRYDPDAQTIEDDAQVRRYEAIAERWADGTQLHILLNDHWVVDNRIPPKGLVANLDTDPVGDRYVLQPDSTWPHFDEVDYAFAPTQLLDATPGEADELELSVRLMYWINTPEYLDFLADENQTNDAGTHVVDAFAQVGGSVPLVLAEASTVVPLSGLSEPGETDTTSETSSEGGSESAGTTTDGSSGGADEVEGGEAGIDDATQGCACTASPRGRAHHGALGLLGLALLGLVRRRR